MYLICSDLGTFRNPAEQCTRGILEHVAGLNLPSFCKDSLHFEVFNGV